MKAEPCELGVVIVFFRQRLLCCFMHTQRHASLRLEGDWDLQDTAFVDVDLEDGDENSRGSKVGRKRKGGEDNNDEGSQMSDSVMDEDASKVDLAEKREQQVRRTLLFSILTACGMIFCIKMIGRLIERLTGDNVSPDGVEQVQGVIETTRESVVQSTLLAGNQSAAA